MDSVMPPLTAEEEAELEAELRLRLRQKNRAAEEKGQQLPRRSILLRRRLINFTKATYPNYLAERFHQRVAQELDEVVNGSIKRLMIFAPPQHGKSELVSIRLPAFWLGKRPDDPIIMTSYAGMLAENFSGQARDVITSDEFQEIFPHVKLKRETKSKKFWRIKNYRAHVRAAGVSGGVTGMGARLGLIDDPVASWAEAQSELVREIVWTWWTGTMRPRIWEGGAVVIVMTRWHEDDLAGRLLIDQPGQWKVLRFPAIAETQAERDEYAEKYHLPKGEPDPLGRQPGEVLSPERFSKQEILYIKREVGSMVFTAQYQGSPRPPEGNVFKTHWFTPDKYINVEDLPEDRYIVRYWDKAGTEGGGKFTVGLKMSVDENGNYYIEDVERAQLSSLKRNKLMYDIAVADAKFHEVQGGVTIWAEQEPGSGGKESGEITIQQLSGFDIHVDKVKDSKGIRLKGFVAQCEAGNVYFVKGHWNKALLGEMLDWSENAKFKDQVDAGSGAFNKLTLERIEQERPNGMLARALRSRGRGTR